MAIRFFNASHLIKEEDKAQFIQLVSVESALRVRIILTVLGLFQCVQIALYLLMSKELYKDMQLIGLKAIVIILCLIFILLIDQATEKSKVPSTPIDSLLIAIIATILIWSVLNTFVAQRITSDISIYLMVLFTISAVVRVKPLQLGATYAICYIVFAFGMPFVQGNKEYVLSHLINGFTFNVIAFIIATLFYNLSITDFLDKLEISKKNKELMFLSQHDGLTKLYNHQTIHEYLEGEIGHTSTSKHLTTVMLIDLDNFKAINDVFGHNAGDTILRQVSQKIRENIRFRDRAGRYGGDEFLVVLPETTLEEAQQIAERILKEIQTISLGEINLTFSCGITQWKDDSATQLIERADSAMYKVKSGGKNGVLVV